MHFLYVDEAGSTGADLTTVMQPVFVIAGLVVSDERWRRTSGRVSQILNDSFGRELDETFELHAGELLSPDGDGPFEGWPREPRNELALRLLDVIHERSHQILVNWTYKARMEATPPPRRNYGPDWQHPWQIGFHCILTFFEEYLRGRRTG